MRSLFTFIHIEVRHCGGADLGQRSWLVLKGRGGTRKVGMPRQRTRVQEDLLTIVMPGLPVCLRGRPRLSRVFVFSVEMNGSVSGLTERKLLIEAN